MAMSIPVTMPQYPAAETNAGRALASDELRDDWIFRPHLPQEVE
jgi:hypothetical protein